MTSGRPKLVIVVAPHPDDETLAFGGSLHDHLEADGLAQVIAVTDGEAADDRADDAGRRELANVRRLERAAALRRLGAENIDVIPLGLPDGNVGEHERRLERQLTGLFTSARHAHPDCTVVLPWPGDPHPDHEATGRAGIAAAAAAGLRWLEAPVWAWYRPEFRALLPRERTLRLPITDRARKAKKEALRCFDSQLQLLPEGHGPVLPTDFLSAFDLPYETVLR